MIYNDPKNDMAVLLHSVGLRKSEVAARLGVTRAAIQFLEKTPAIRPAWEKFCDVIGYDIEIVYHKRPEEAEKEKE